MITLVTTRRKPKIKLNDIEEQDHINKEIAINKFDLYESIYDFTTKQNQYIRSLG